MSFLLPHMLEEGRGNIDVYFTRVYNPLWVNPDGFMWLKALQDESKIKCYVALTPTWNETAWFADYVLPMGHGPERHDLMSQETHAGQWIAFRQPVRRVALERAGTKVDFTYQANPGEVWEENEFWIQLSAHFDPDGSLGIRQYFESPYRPGEIITVDEYYQWIFENSVPGLPEASAKEGLTPLEYMRKYGVFEVKKENYVPFEKTLAVTPEAGFPSDQQDRVLDSSGGVVGLWVDGQPKVGFDTPSRRLEFFSPTLADWGWDEKQYVIPWSVKSHVHPDHINREAGEMILLPNFRLPTLIHTRSANAKWLYEISHKNPIWMNPDDAKRIGVETGELVRVDTEIGYFVDSAWVTEGIKPGVIAISHHLGRWRLQEDSGVNRGASNLVKLTEDGNGGFLMRVVHGAQPYESGDPDTKRVWWSEVGVSQNLTHAVHPDPVSGVHCWLQKATSVRKAREDERAGDVFVDTKCSMEKYREWLAMTRPAEQVSPDGTRRPYWLARPLKPSKEAYKLSR
jgi:anaerobic selenocysteine-containing dehydrogenase